jgi:hypothetical protein
MYHRKFDMEQPYQIMKKERGTAMNRSRKLIAAILSAAMIAASSPAAALADGGENLSVIPEYSNSENQEQQQTPDISEGVKQEAAENSSEDQEKQEEPAQPETTEQPENPEAPQKPDQTQEETKTENEPESDTETKEPEQTQKPEETPEQPEQTEKTDKESTSDSTSEVIFSYNLGIGAGTVSIHEDEIAEDGSFTIPLEDDAFFPYSLQIQHDGKTWVETFDTPDNTIKIGEYQVGVETRYNGESLSQIGVYVDGEYYPALPEKKTFSEEIQSFSLLPPANDDYARYLRIDLTDIAPNKKDKIKVDAIIGKIDGLDTTGKVVLWNYRYDENGGILPDDSFRPMGNGTVDLSHSSNYEPFDLIVGTGHQLDTGHFRYHLTIELLLGPDFLGGYQELDKEGNIISKTEDVRGSYYSNAPDVTVYHYSSSDPLSPDREYRFILKADTNYSDNFDVHIYKGHYDSIEAAVENGEDVTEAMMGLKGADPSGYKVDFTKEEAFTAVTTMKTSADYHQLDKFRLQFTQRNTALSFEGLYDSEASSVIYTRDYNDITVSGKRIRDYSFYLKPEDFPSGQYFAKFNTGDYQITKAVVGHYDNLEAAEGQQDIKEQLFGEKGYQACFKDGVSFTIFAERPSDNRSVKYYYTITTYSYPGSSNRIISFYGIDGYDKSEIYLLQDENDSGVEQFGYRLILVDDENVNLSSLVPQYNRYQENIGVFVHGNPDDQKTPYDFSKGPVQYTARAENGEDICNYWLAIEHAQQEAKLYVVVDGEKVDEREIFFNNWTNNHHDIFIANIGKADLTGLKVELSNAKNVKLDDYWTVGGEDNSVLPGIDRATANSPWSSSPDYMDGTAKIRLIPTGSGEVSGTLTISSENGGEKVIQLKGEAGDPSIITEQGQLDNKNAVKYVPYSFLFQNNNKYEWNKTTFTLADGSLPKGMELRPSGELYGVSTETGTFTFTVRMINSYSTFEDDMREYTLVVLENTDSNVEGETDVNYEIENRVEDMFFIDYVEIGMPGSTVRDQIFTSKGGYDEFEALWLDGKELMKDIDYEAKAGSTVITIYEQTFANYFKEGTHTIAAEFRTQDEKHELNRTAQNFTLTIKNSTNNDNSGSSSGGNNTGSDINDNSDSGDSNNSDNSNKKGPSQNSAYINPVTAAQQAAASQNSESTSSKLRVHLKGINLVTLPEFREMSSIARKEGKEPWLDVDTMVDGTNRVDIRIGLNTELPQTDLYMAGSTQNTRTALVKTIFERYFSNQIVAIINLSQKDNFGLTANICVKVPEGIKAEDLHFYSYRYERNSYRVIQDPKAWIDQNHYLHFDTPYAADIVITAGDLVLK